MKRLTYYYMKGSENDGWYLKPGVKREEAIDRLAHYENLEERGKILTDEVITKIEEDKLALLKIIEKTAQATSKWISVEERLPKHGEMALCNTKWFFEVLQWDEIGETWCGKDRTYSVSYVTHWMPLPKPPEV